MTSETLEIVVAEWFCPDLGNEEMFLGNQLPLETYFDTQESISRCTYH